jgi:FtsP/CotA-like multicopper oxidase with cupredoxin domain
MFRAGLDPRVSAGGPPPKNDGDVSETVSTLWYHDHSMDHTSENVYKGLVGFHLLFDEVDSGNENDPDARALRLPSGEFDIPLLIQDKRFDSDGQLFLPDATLDPLARFGFLGDRFVVNGQIQPKLTVQRRKYRFRLLDAGPSRFYQLFLATIDTDPTKNVDHKFQQIGNDESLFEKPLEVQSVLLGVAERMDIVIDFSKFNKGDQLYLVNRLVMEDLGHGPVAEMDANDKFVKYKSLPADESEGKGDYILRFDVGDDAADPSQVPAKLRTNPALPAFTQLTPDDLKKLPNHREFEFSLDQVTGDTWLVNKKPFDPSPAGAATMPNGTLLRAGSLATPRLRLAGEDPDGEVWTIVNGKGSTWAHPVHIHLEEFRILWRDGKAPPAYEQCKKDVLDLAPNEEVQIYLRHRDFLGKYPIHCHNVVHEDHEMMLRFDVVGDN